MMNISILKYLPHRPPMQMVDTITHINDTSIVTEFLIPEDCIFLEKEYFTESGLIENMAQTCSAIVGQFFFGLEEDTKRVIGYISAIKKAEIFSLPKVLHTIRTEATLLSRYDDKGYSICAMDCGVYHQEKTIGTGTDELIYQRIGRMKEQEMPNQKGALEGLKEVCYVTDNQGNYTTALSEGWEVKDIAIESSMNLLQEQMQKAKEQIQAGKQSPIVYYMARARMDWVTLASYMGQWQWIIKRHARPKVFAKLSEKTLKKYAEIFDISVEELTNFPSNT